MIHNYLTVAWRNLLKNKMFSFINISGLAIGIAACLLILEYVSFELSYDTFHENKNNIYRIIYQESNGDAPAATTPPALAPAIRQEFADVLQFARVTKTSGIVRYNDGKKDITFSENNIAYADSTFLRLFTFPVTDGNAEKALNEPGTAVISQSIARKYFGTANPINRSITLNNRFKPYNYIVKGVFKDVPVNSHIKFDILFSLNTLANKDNLDGNGWADLSGWNWGSFYTYLLLKPGTKSEQLAAQLYPVLKEKYNWEKEGHFQLQALADIHLHSDLQSEAEANGSITLIYFLCIVALFILIIAYINYINLSTIRATERGKEVGIRKVAGASRMQLVGQFLQEAFILNLLALIFAVTLFQLCKPYFITLTEKPLSLYVWQGDSWKILLGFSVLFVTGILLSGLYPAVFLSSFKPVSVLKKNITHSGKGIIFRKGLVVFQFVASAVLLIGTFTVYLQLNFMRNQDLGMNMERLLIIEKPQIADSTYEAKAGIFKNEMLKSSALRHISYIGSLPGEGYNWSSDFWRADQKTVGADKRILGAKPCAVTYVDSNFVHTFEIKLLTQNSRFRELHTYGDDEAVLLNEAAAKELGFTNYEDAINKKISSAYLTEATVLGVVSNYHHKSLKETYDPMVFVIRNGGGYCALKFNTGNTPSARIPAIIAEAKNTYQTLFPGNPFTYFFLEESFNQQYKSDEQFGQVFSFFAGLAIMVACMGLYGLAFFTTAQRTKEIGVRKVLGASVRDILLLINKDFIKLIILANLIAWPLAYWGIRNWLENYAFRIDISLWLFLFPALLVLLIALLTVSIQTIKASIANPVKALKYE